MSTRRRIEPQTVALRPIELTALLQMTAAAGGDGAFSEPDGSTVEMVALEAEVAEVEDEVVATTKMARIEEHRTLVGHPLPDARLARVRPTLEMSPLAKAAPPAPVLARGTEPIGKTEPEPERRARRLTRRGPPGSRG